MPSSTVIVGAGFGGYTLARALDGSGEVVTLVDRENYHLFTPLLYQVASALLNPSDIAYPIRRGLRRTTNVAVVRDTVTALDTGRRCISLASGRDIPYGRLVVAAGSGSTFFDVPGARAFSFGVKTLSGALALRNHLLTCFERAEAASDLAVRGRLLTFVVAGGGPTGVEYAGALSELARVPLARDYPGLRDNPIRIVLVEPQPRLLSMFEPRLTEYAARALRRKGVELKLGVAVESAEAGNVRLSDGSAIQTDTLIWAAGVRGADLGAALLEAVGGLDRRKDGRIPVDDRLRLPGHDDIYVIGDMAAVEQDGALLPMLAPVAIQQARFLSRRFTRGDDRPFRYRDKGIMATIGRGAAVTQTGRLRLKGFPGWIAWLLLHLYMLIGFRNRFVVLTEWAWDYVRFDRPIRIILRASDGRRPPEPQGSLEGDVD